MNPIGQAFPVINRAYAFSSYFDQGQRVTLFESLDRKTPCLMHTLANQL